MNPRQPDQNTHDQFGAPARRCLALINQSLMPRSTPEGRGR
jgi:hypothetical protein